VTDGLNTDVERLNLALDAARLGDWSWDAHTDVITLSPLAAEIYGVASGMTRTAMRELLHPDDREPARRAAAAAMTQRTDYRIEYRLINGERERWVSVSGRGRYDAAGRALGMLGVVQDITSDRLLVLLDDAVRQLNDPAEIVFTAARMLGSHLRVNRCAYATVDADEDTFELLGNYTAGTHSIVGRYRFRQFGAECLALMRRGEPYAVVDSEHDERIDATDREAYRRTAIRAVICVPVHKSGRFVAGMAVHTLEPRQWADNEVELVQRVASRCWESIERVRVDRERVRLLQMAEQANRAKDEFLAMLGHELRNPLAPIVTALQLMKLRGDTASERERTVIERQVGHLTRLVDDLLDVSRIARGKVELKMEDVEIAEIVSRAIEISSVLFEQRGQSLTVSVPQSGLRVHGDTARLAQVVSNLLTNASKYTPPHGRVNISAWRERGEIALRVSDTGMGIAADALPGLFDLFVQGRQHLDRSQGGLGLGLAIVKSLVERHGGRVEAQSDGPGLGSQFLVTLPDVANAERETTVTPAASPPAPESVRARLLVVDDNADAATLLAEALVMMGHEVDVAHDGPEALRIADGRTYDAGFLDIGLPVMDGYELAARLRELPGFAATRLVAVTGYGQPSDRAESERAGIAHHFVKPVDAFRLQALFSAAEPATG